MTDKGFLIHKCRLCGEEYITRPVDYLQTVLLHHENKSIVNYMWKHSVHKCNDGRYGVTDLVGGVKKQ